MNLPAALRGNDARHGLQLGAAVVLSYLASAAVGLPEGFWAVMSALIVTRPDTGATLGAGWDRVRGTLLGSTCGLLGVWLRHAGLGAPTATLAIVALLAFASAGVPILRSAPITALIILSSGGIAGHSALQVAGLRVGEIAIGVAVGLGISVALPAARATGRFNAECAGVLRQIAAQVGQAVGGAGRSADQKDAASAAMRAALRELVLLSDSAGRESRLSLSRLRRWRGGSAPEASERPSHRRVAQLVMRTSQDAALLGRVFESQPQSHQDALWRALRDAACDGLESAAQAIISGQRADLAPLRRIDESLAVRRRGALPDEVALLLAGPLRWLLDDLRALGRIGASSIAR